MKWKDWLFKEEPFGNRYHFKSCGCLMLFEAAIGIGMVVGLIIWIVSLFNR